jgi:hypothetical protein
VPEWFKRSVAEEPPAEEAPAPKVPLFIARRKREGFLEYGDRLYPETERMGETTFARKREPGLRHGALRAPDEE